MSGRQLNVALRRSHVVVASLRVKPGGSSKRSFLVEVFRECQAERRNTRARRSGILKPGRGRNLFVLEKFLHRPRHTVRRTLHQFE
jgi:hypothetical protein